MNNGAVGYMPAVVGIPLAVAQAISEHWSAWVTYQIAVGEEASLLAEDAEGDALYRLLATPVEDEAGLAAVVAHLEWYAVEEAQRYIETEPLNRLPFSMLANLRVALARGGVVAS